jgi:hypothetical protein
MCLLMKLALNFGKYQNIYSSLQAASPFFLPQNFKTSQKYKKCSRKVSSYLTVPFHKSTPSYPTHSIKSHIIRNSNIKWKLCVYVFTYSLRTDKPTSTKHGMLASWEQEEILERWKLQKLVLSLILSEGGSCSSETKQDRRKLSRAKPFVSDRLQEQRSQSW